MLHRTLLRTKCEMGPNRPGPLESVTMRPAKTGTSMISLIKCRKGLW